MLIFSTTILLSCVGVNKGISVSFNSMGGSHVSTQYFDNNGFLSEPETYFEGHTLEGWYISYNQGRTLNRKWSFTDDIVTYNLTLYAKWNKNLYFVSFNVYGGDPIDQQSYKFGEKLSVPIPTKVGNTFRNWYIDEHFKDIFDFEIMPSRNLNLHAKWSINQYTITFQTNGGTVISPITGDYGSSFSIPNNPSKLGHTFVGWYTNFALTNQINFVNTLTIPSNNVTYYSKWQINTYSITFETNGGMIITPINKLFDSSLNLPIPLKDGQTFIGWYLNSELTNPLDLTKMPAYDLILYAKWEINLYTITYKLPSFGSRLFDIDLLENEKIIDLIAQSRQSAALTNFGRVFFWGRNIHNELPDGTIISLKPVDHTSLFSLNESEKIISISLGSAHGSALTNENRVFSWGNNYWGELGDFTNINRNVPVDITANFNLASNEIITFISLGSGNSSAITSFGRVFTWGRNTEGQLGDGTTISKNYPNDITSQFSLLSNDKMVGISMGYLHSASYSYYGNVFTWGKNSSGSLGDGTLINKLNPNNITNFFTFEENEKTISISTSENFTLSITNLGSVFSWGYNFYGQLGIGNNIQSTLPINITNTFNLDNEYKIMQVATGEKHCLSVSNNGLIFSWGYNGYGQLGSGNFISSNIPKSISGKLALYNNEIPNKIASGYNHSLILTNEGRVFIWGSNDVGQLGDNTKVIKPSPFELTNIVFFVFTIVNYYYLDNIQLITPEYKDFSFQAWYLDENYLEIFNLSQMPKNNLILYGKWN